jgi:hypothetical protein
VLSHSERRYREGAPANAGRREVGSWVERPPATVYTQGKGAGGGRVRRGLDEEVKEGEEGKGKVQEGGGWWCGINTVIIGPKA